MWFAAMQAAAATAMKMFAQSQSKDSKDGKGGSKGPDMSDIMGIAKLLL